MNNTDLTEKAQTLGLLSAQRRGSETALVRAIQKAHGDEPCFMTDKRLLCNNLACDWRKECRRLVAAWKR